MDVNTQHDLVLIKESVLQAVPAEAIYLFGSYAYGTPTKDSDIDIYVVVPDDTEDLSELYADIQGLLRKKTLPQKKVLICKLAYLNICGLIVAVF